jgi:hypothetical protein
MATCLYICSSMNLTLSPGNALSSYCHINKRSKNTPSLDAACPNDVVGRFTASLLRCKTTSESFLLSLRTISSPSAKDINLRTSLNVQYCYRHSHFLTFPQHQHLTHTHTPFHSAPNNVPNPPPSLRLRPHKTYLQHALPTRFSNLYQQPISRPVLTTHAKYTSHAHIARIPSPRHPNPNANTPSATHRGTGAFTNLTPTSTYTSGSPVLSNSASSQHFQQLW